MNGRETQNSYMQYLGEKVTGQICVSSLTIKLCETEWEMWNFIKHTLHASNITTKSTVLAHTNGTVSCHFNRGTIGLATRCHFLKKRGKHPLVSPNQT